MPTFKITVDASNLNASEYEAWCEIGPEPGIEFLGNGNGGVDGALEQWLVTADDQVQAQAIAETAMGDWNVSIHSVEVKS